MVTFLFIFVLVIPYLVFSLVKRNKLTYVRQAALREAVNSLKKNT
jgi:hypothetical protein